MLFAMAWRAILGAGFVVAAGTTAPPDHAVALAVLALISSVALAMIGVFAPLIRDIVRARRSRLNPADELAAAKAKIASLERQLRRRPSRAKS